MSGYIYNECKLLHHLDKLGTGVPISMTLLITNRCNIRCKFCYYRSYPGLDAFDPNSELDIKVIGSIVKQFRSDGGMSVKITGGGEPTIHPDINSIISLIEELGLEWGLVTNGTHPGVITGDPTWIRISINAATEATWKFVHLTNNSFDSYIDGVRDIINRFTGHGTTVGSSFLICRENYHEIPLFAKMCSELGMAYVRYGYAITPARVQYFDDIADDISRLLDDAAGYSSGKFEVITQRDTLGRMNQVDRGFDRCYYTEHTPLIGADGYLYPCWALGYMSKFRVRNLSGLNKPDFTMTMDPKLCPPCNMDQKNRDIESLIKIRDGCKHYNFI